MGIPEATVDEDHFSVSWERLGLARPAACVYAGDLRIRVEGVLDPCARPERESQPGQAPGAAPRPWIRSVL